MLYFERERERLLTKWAQSFELTCPTYIGPEANDALHEAICGYMESELEAAEQEEVSTGLSCKWAQLTVRA